MIDGEHSYLAIDLLHPVSGRFVGVTLHCAPPDGDRVRSEQQAKRRRAGRRGEPRGISDQAAVLAAAIVGWEWLAGVVIAGLASPPYSQVNAERLVTVGWVADQVAEGLATEAAFFDDAAEDLADYVRASIHDPETASCHREQEYLASWFWSMNAGRSEGYSGPNPLSSAEMAAWATVTGHAVRPEEFAVLRAMDVAYIAAAREMIEGKAPGAAPETVSDRVMTPELFDAIFG